MNVDEYVWGDAEVTYPDWSGTAQLDKKLSTDLYGLLGIDDNEFVIIGLDVGGGESGMHQPHVIAVRRPEWEDLREPDISEIRAVDIQIHNGIDPFDLLRQIMHMFDFRLRIRSTVGSTIIITELLDEPPQD